MKTRNGFVSNSSSSSFVVFGVKLKDHPELDAKLKTNNNGYEEYGRETEALKQYPENTEVRNYGEKFGFVLGWEIVNGDDTELNVKKVSFEELQDYAVKFKAKSGVYPVIMGGMNY